MASQNTTAVVTTLNAADDRKKKLLNSTLAENKRLREENQRLVTKLVDAQVRIDTKPLEFIVGDFGSVSADPEKDRCIELTLLTYNLTVDDQVTTTHITPEQAFAMGNAFLHIAKQYGFEPIQPDRFSMMEAETSR